MMKLIRRGGLLAVAIAVLAIPAASQAAPVRECGTYDSATGRFTFAPVDGAISVGNLTTRNVSCSTARRLSLRYRGTDSFYPTWKCREVSEYESSDIRCTASRGRVIHWQAGA
jgi:hypothetical protein